MKKTLTLISGVSGNGKTELANKIVHADFDPPENTAMSRIAIAADNYQGLYVDGVYQNHLQKESHGWCQGEVEFWMKESMPEIVVHNTFVKKMYMQPYLQLAKEYGYAVHVVHSEAVILPDGTRTKNTHNLPDEVLETMKNGWENFDPLPKLGITPAQIATQLKDLKYPQVIIFDMDNTIKRPKNNQVFPSTPDDFEIMPEFAEAAGRLYDPEVDLYIISNQLGLLKGQKTPAFLNKEIDLLENQLHRMGLFPIQMYFAINKEEYIVKSFSANEWLSSNAIKPITKSSYVKPDTGMFEAAIFGSAVNDVWIVGDAHTDNFATDWQFAQNCQKLRPDLDIRYIPIELLNIAWNMV